VQPASMPGAHAQGAYRHSSLSDVAQGVREHQLACCLEGGLYIVQGYKQCVACAAPAAGMYSRRADEPLVS
jgi:hypothetical protein